jgi:hypothetical protein
LFSDDTPCGAALRFASEAEFADSKLYLREIREQRQARLERILVYAISLFLLWSFAAKFMLEYAVKAGNPDYVEVMMLISARPGNQLLSAAQYALNSEESSRPERLRIISELTRTFSSDGRPVIFEIIKAGRLYLLAALYAHGANLDFRDTAGETLLMVDICQKNMEIVVSDLWLVCMRHIGFPLNAAR